MTLVFIAWGDYGGWRHSVRCAAARAKADRVYVIGQQKYRFNTLGADWLNLEDFLASKKLIPDMISGHGDGLSCAYSLTRWIVVKELAASGRATFPIFTADWDMMLFSDLKAACQPFLQYDFSVTVNHPNDADVSAAYLITRIEPLVIFQSNLERVLYGDDTIAKEEYAKYAQDMGEWQKVFSTKQFTRGVMSRNVNGGTFDHNIECPGDGLEMEGPAKRIYWQGQTPFFRRVDNGEYVKAHCIHCWGSHKNREVELAGNAGI